MKIISWGIIGCGKVTEIKSGPALQKAENSALAAVMRRNGDLAEDYAKRHNVPRWYDNADELINDPGVDAVYVATPPDSHLEYVSRCAKAGKPVYVEKPMARSFDECKAMIEACSKAGVPLFVAYYKRALPRFLKIKELVDNGAVGEVRFVTMTLYQPPYPAECDRERLPWRVKPEIAGAGNFMDLACHTINVLEHILGPISRAQGIASNQGGLYAAEDIVSANLRFASGVHATGNWCFTAFSRYDMNEIVGTKGKLSFSTFGSNPILLVTESGTMEFPIVNPVHIQQPFIQTIVNELNGQGTCPSKGENASQTSWVMDEILKGYYKKG
jgi:predicted dehydrogenase